MRSDMPPRRSVRYQIAQKLHAVTEQPTDGYANLRYRDLIDILLLGELVEDPRAVRDVHAAAEQVRTLIASLEASAPTRQSDASKP
jgi:hypothetical protein